MSTVKVGIETHAALGRMFERIEVARSDSDTALFYDLLIAGELVLKLSVAGLTAGVAEDRDRNRYRIEHRLVRADGLGEWVEALGEITTGPAAQHLAVAASEDRRELMQRWSNNDDAWQRSAVDLLESTCDCVDPKRQNAAAAKVSLSRWHDSFVWLRNRTRAHGAPTGGKCAKAVVTLEQSVRTVAENFGLFNKPWVYLKRNLNGRYRVVPIAGDATPFAYLKSEAQHALEEGVYIFFDEPQLVQLVYSDVDLSDFYVANGNFTERRFEVLSYISDLREEVDSTPFLAPASSLPKSETSGYPNLEVVGETFSNVPPRLRGYVHRPDLEHELREVLLDDRHPVITLFGRGGIGKTSLALEVIHQVCANQSFEAILWFSARDIDLMQEGPKRVAPDVLTQADIADQMVELLTPQGANEKAFDDRKFLNDALAGQLSGGPFLFAFDNFETVYRPIELYQSLDTYIRLPNKILLTSRMRDFKADFPVSVSGMTREEFEELALGTAARLGIKKLVTSKYLDDLYAESDGHPYVVKMLLGAVARTGRVGAVERVLAGREEVLDALFERTFQALAPAAQRVFLTLASWRSIVSRLALEAALLRPSNERMDVASAVDELERSSMIETIRASSDNEEFLRVPLAAAVFGRRKLAVSALRSVVEADTEFLRLFGAAKAADVDRGLQPRLKQMAEAIVARLGDDEAFEEGVDVLGYVARSYPPAWFSLADVYLAARNLEGAENSIEQYIQRRPRDYDAWRRLADVRRERVDRLGELHARVELAELPGATYRDAVHVAGLLNGWLHSGALRLEGDEKRVLTSRIRELLEDGIGRANATELSRLAWICIHDGDREAAKRYTRMGLEQNPENEHCQALAGRLKVALE